MSFFPILDLIAGMIFIYFLLAIVNNSCLELYAAITHARARMLVKWIRSTFGPTAGTLLKAMPGAVLPGMKIHAYIEAKDFYHAILLQIHSSNKAAQPGEVDFYKLPESIDKTDFPEPIRNLFKSFAARSLSENGSTDNFEICRFERQIENWFTVSMRHLTDLYKRSVLNFAFTTLITLALNIDTLQLASYLYGNRDTRERLAVASYSYNPSNAKANVAERDSLITRDRLPSFSDEVKTKKYRG